MLLSELRCSACREDAPSVEKAEQPDLLRQIPRWTIVYEDDQPKLRRQFAFTDFKQAMNFTIAVGVLAEQENHHPEIVTEWGKVTVFWWTHIIKGLHKNDFILAAKTDALE